MFKLKQIFMEGKRYLKLGDIGAYKVSFYLSNYVWNLIVNWDYLSKDTVGKQFIRAIDSVSANIAEGFGRNGKNDKIKFYYYSFGSLNESLDWNQKSLIRGLITQEQYKHIFGELQKLPREINYLIKFTREKLTM